VNISGGTNIVNTFLRLAYYGGGGAAATGTLNITNGTVQANNIIAGGGTSTINLSGGKLIVSNSIGSAAAPLSALAVNNGAMLKFPLVSGVTPVVVNNFSSDSSGVINISSLPAIPGYPSQFPLISYQAGGSGVAFSLGALPGTFTGYVSNDNSSTLWVVITNGPSLASVLWGGGVNNLWDTSSLNWTNNANAVKYQDLYAVTFDDSAKTNNITLVNTFTPSIWTQSNNILNYTFSGTGSISGLTSLVMDGSASVTLAENRRR
jgi:hypothetical protein